MNPLLGRWVSADPLAVHTAGKADFNVYAYVKGMTLKAIDPRGLKLFIHSSVDKTDDGGKYDGPDRRAEVMAALQAGTEDELGMREVKGKNGRTAYEVYIKEHASCSGDSCKAGTELLRTLVGHEKHVVLTRAALEEAQTGEHKISLDKKTNNVNVIYIHLDLEKVAAGRMETLGKGKQRYLFGFIPIGRKNVWVKETVERLVNHELVHAYRFLSAKRIWNDYDTVKEEFRLPSGRRATATTKREETETTGVTDWTRAKNGERQISENLILRERGLVERAAYSVHRFDGKVYVDGEKLKDK